MLSIKFQIHCLYFVYLHIPIYYHIHKAFVTIKIQISENIIESSIIALVGTIMLNIIILQCHSNIINS